MGKAMDFAQVLVNALIPLTVAGAGIAGTGTAGNTPPAALPHPPQVTLDQCHKGGGVAIADCYIHWAYHCQNGRFGGHPIAPIFAPPPKPSPPTVPPRWYPNNN